MFSGIPGFGLDLVGQAKCWGSPTWWLLGGELSPLPSLLPNARPRWLTCACVCKFLECTSDPATEAVRLPHPVIAAPFPCFLPIHLFTHFG